VESQTLTCTATTGDGKRCGQTATVLHVCDVYAPQIFNGGGGVSRPVLTEAHYEIECPLCGRRTQVVAAGIEPHV
jgi:hypothetical protein